MLVSLNKTIRGLCVFMKFTLQGNPGYILSDERTDGKQKPDSLNIINLVDVVKIYESPAGRFTALKGIDLTINQGEFVAVVGKSGSGKSTLMNMITGIDRPTSGAVYVDEIGIHRLSEGKIAIWRGRTVGIVFQFFQLLPTLSVIENVMLPMDFCHMFSTRERKDRAVDLLEQVELVDQAYKLPSALSGGQQQRVAIARALANDPPILIADEPTGNLDTHTASAIYELFTNLIDKGKTILMVTHDQDMAQEVSRTIYLVDGRIVDESYYASDHKDEYLIGSGQTGVDSKTGLNPDEEAELRSRISQILEDLPNAAERLKEEIFESQVINGDAISDEEVYRIIIDEVNYKAKAAEEDGKPENARELWRVLLEATE
jgi:putative ABC transport system ATP-binding protein